MDNAQVESVLGQLVGTRKTEPTRAAENQCPFIRGKCRIRHLQRVGLRTGPAVLRQRLSRESVQVSYGPGVPSRDRTGIGPHPGTQGYPRGAVL